MKIRDAVEADLPEILAIYNEIIINSTAVYSDDPATLEERTDWWRGRTAHGYPVIVACNETGIMGFASFGEFRARSGYRYSVESTVHVHANCRGQGVGTQLIEALLSRARLLGKHTMIAAIDSTNKGSIHLHERLGFTQAGYLHEAAYKFGHWLDVVLMQYHL